MTKMHENEFEIDEHLVHALLDSQCSQLAKLPLSAITSSGTDNALFHLGSEYVVRLPRLAGADETINKEYEWVPRISRFLEMSVSVPLFKGNSNKSYPSSWMVTKWCHGCNPVFEKDNEYVSLAKDLAHFLNELHAIKLANGPISRRGVPLKQLEDETKKAIGKLTGEVDIQYVTSIWHQLSNTPAWNKDPVWIHGDFLPGNILVQNNRLSGVIDFSDVGIGDPACDLVIAWGLLNSHSRKIFRENLENIDDNTWERGRGWALSIALIMLPYYMHTNLVLVSLATRMIENVLSESDT
jgi:aminoglycoside phosphotransferase (APT) family kinase protein